jgi:hypothetical protein
VTPLRLLVAALAVLGGCRPSPDAKGDAGPGPAETAGPQPPLSFDPANIREGLLVGGLRVDSADVAWSEELREWVGSVRFAGDVRLAGTTIVDSAGGAARACFEADSASASYLPRWPGDERRSWFCFENADTARRLLGAAATSSRAVTIVVNRFTTLRAQTDAVNSAWLVAAE